MTSDRLPQLIEAGLREHGKILVLTGAGISAESGIPTFRGPEGYWTIGSKVYQPEEMATYRMFRQDPQAVWQWYHYRQAVCRRAAPNPGHYALVALEKRFPEQFLLVTQNVDNLHLLAGQDPVKTYQIHGNLFYARCAADCRQAIEALPDDLIAADPQAPIAAAHWAKLRCRHCGEWLRPHVLWFDEYYNEIHFRWESTLQAAAAASLLIVIGTSGATTLPVQVVELVHRRGGVIIDINVTDNPFGRLAAAYSRGSILRMGSGEALPMLVDLMSSI